jgi:SAM-dependent methyltransferase
VGDDRAQRHRLRTTFGEAAEAYDRARPGYPDVVFDELLELGGLVAGDRALEIGPGTGQATVPLAQRGLRVTAVELSPTLAAVARRRLAPFEHVEVVEANFEAWRPAVARFDAVLAFTAFHWLDPERGYAKAADLLRPGGALAVVQTAHVLEADGDPFFAEVQADYDAVVPDESTGPPGPAADVPDLAAEIAASGRFAAVGVRRHAWDAVYTAEAYVALLDTYSGHRAMPADARRELHRRIARRIDARPGRRVRKTYLTTLNIARRR